MCLSESSFTSSSLFPKPTTHQIGSRRSCTLGERTMTMFSFQCLVRITIVGEVGAEVVPELSNVNRVDEALKLGKLPQICGALPRRLALDFLERLFQNFDLHATTTPLLVLDTTTQLRHYSRKLETAPVTNLIKKSYLPALEAQASSSS